MKKVIQIGVSSLVVGLVGFQLGRTLQTKGEANEIKSLAPSGGESTDYDPFVGGTPPWEENLEAMSGIWVSADPNKRISVNVDFHMVTFSTDGEWHELDGVTEYVGHPEMFVIDGFLYHLIKREIDFEGIFPADEGPYLFIYREHLKDENRFGKVVLKRKNGSY